MEQLLIWVWGTKTCMKLYSFWISKWSKMLFLIFASLCSCYISVLNNACGDLVACDRPIFLDKRSKRCQVASPIRRGSKKSSACLFSSFHRFFCMTLRLVAATCNRILANLGTSVSLTLREMAFQSTACEYGKAMLSAIITGTHPNTTDSTIRGLHGAHPSGQRQNIDLSSSAW